MMRRQSLLREQSGVAILEMAVVLPTFFLILFGLFNFSNVMLGYCSATYAARAAARYASLHSTASLAPCTSNTCVSNIVSPYILSYLPKTMSVSTTWSPSATVGSTVQVNVTIKYTMAIPNSSLTTVSVGSTAQRTILR